ncbi:transposase [Candidatus Enterovibrio escicola]|uniref:Mobile element protein n=1 Tax=Candidatus Enterovibrio escicola TaxID=1927127 RepID=A0A2A5T6Q9_9GAMM|nr:transposase [Candidatus Enterovibrio escacola]PCS23853.1 hypothetical protein BTN49_0824 [Candidatus Enterovibrio escacola]
MGLIFFFIPVIISVKVTTANMDDRKLVSEMTDELLGCLWCL